MRSTDVRRLNSDVRMRVIPAHDALTGELLIFYGIDVLPGVLGKSNVGASLFGIFPLDTGADLNVLVFILSDQHPADLGGHGGAGVLPDVPHDLAID